MGFDFGKRIFFAVERILFKIAIAGAVDVGGHFGHGGQQIIRRGILGLGRDGILAAVLVFCADAILRHAVFVNNLFAAIVKTGFVGARIFLRQKLLFFNGAVSMIGCFDRVEGIEGAGSGYGSLNILRVIGIKGV